MVMISFGILVATIMSNDNRK
ncbi:hypothetical protein [uncultured Marinococcus sp.]